MARRTSEFKNTVNEYVDMFLNGLERQDPEFDDQKAVAWLKEKLQSLKYNNENRPTDIS